MYTTDERKAPTFEVFDSFEDFKGHSHGPYLAFPTNVIASVASALGEAYEIELDI